MVLRKVHICVLNNEAGHFQHTQKLTKNEQNPLRIETVQLLDGRIWEGHYT